MLKTIELPIVPEGVDTTELDKHIAEGWKIVAVSPDTMAGKVMVRLEKED